MQTSLTDAPARATFLNVVRQPRSYINLFYLFLAFPLGTMYFVLLVTGLSVGLSTLIIWIGVPILGLMGLASWGLTAMEREMAIHWLGIAVPPMSTRVLPENANLWTRTKSYLGNPTLWKGLVYLFVKFPFGIFSFTLVVTLVSLSFGLALEPLVYLVSTSLYHAFGWGGNDYTLSLFTGELISINGTFDWANFLKLLTETPLGLALGLLSLHVMNGVAWLWGQFARLMLGTPSQSVA